MTRRLLFSYLGLTLVILAALEVPLAINYRERLTSDLSADLVRDGFAIGGFAEETVEGTSTRTTDLNALAERYEDETGARVVIVDAAGKVLADSQPEIGSSDFASRPEIELALGGEVATGTRRSDTLDTDLLYAAVPIASNGQVHGAVRVTFSTEQITERWRRYVLTLLGVAAVCMVAAASMGVFFARWVTRPLRRLEEAALSLGAGQLDVRASVDDGPPEVRELAAKFNSMATEIDELVRAQQAFVADASHQLRSPLAALRLRIENVQSDLADDASDEVRTDLGAALTETARLSRIIDGLLALARADRTGEATALARADLDVQTLFDDRLTAWQAYATDRGVDLAVTPSDLHVLAGHDRVVQVLDNLVANAIEATAGRDGARVHLLARPTDFADEPDRSANGYVDLHVVDNGPGMPPEQRAHAFDRFWQAPASPSDGGASARTARRGGGATSGSGLGLAIARKLAVADGGELVLAGVDAGGLDAIIRLPAPAGARSPSAVTDHTA